MLELISMSVFVPFASSQKSRILDTRLMERSTEVKRAGHEPRVGNLHDALHVFANNVKMIFWRSSILRDE